MKAAFFATLLVATPLALAAPNAPADAEVRTVVVRANGNDGGVVTLNGDDEIQWTGDVAIAVGDADDARGRAVMVRVKSTEEVDANHGWLGIALGNSEDAGGVIVLNVVKDSPAQAAGLAEGDVILSINGTSIDDYKTAVDSIRAVEPGGLAAVTVDRDGQMLNLSAKLSSRPTAMTWVKDPEGLQLRDIHKGKVFVLTPNGQQQLGGGLFNVNKSVTVENGQKTVQINVERDDDSFTVTRVGDGPIVVERDGVVTEYADTASLQAADPDAAEVFDQSEGHMIFLPNHGGMQFQFGDADMDFGATLPEDFTEQLHEQLQQAFSGAAFDFQIDNLHDALDHAKAMTFDFSKARRSFKTTPNGQIEVIVRRGGDELVTVYANEADLQTRAPDLYDKYVELLEADISDME